MHSKWLVRFGLTALVAGTAVSSGAMVGCAAERDPINRVQTNAIPKSFLLGDNYNDPADDPEFYGRTMVIDVPYGESGSDFLMFTNTINQVSRIKWAIEGGTADQFNTYLVGRVSFERLDNTDGKGLPPKQMTDRDPGVPIPQQDGLVVYQFPIVSHFDIRRSYNAQTGEESNVIEENATDRPWQERDYVRVDFSKNLVTTAYDFDTLSLLGVYNGIKWTQASMGVGNPNDENAPVIDVNSGYMDVTNKMFAAPQMLRIWGMEFPGCLLPNVLRGGTEPVGNCNPNEVTLRHSFKRVVDTDYEPTDWDGQRFETYGAFTTQRNGYNADYGTRDELWRRYISRYNVWERSHYYTDLENMTGAVTCGSDEDCSEIGGVRGISKCDGAKRKCTLPFRDRKVKPIVWHYADKSAPEYFDASREAAEEWDTAMRIATQVAKYAECQRFEPGDCAQKYPGVVKGNFADEEDAMYLVKEVEACRREARKNNLDLRTCDATADEVGSARSYSPEVIALAKLDPVVVLCHSPVADLDSDLCGEKGTVARLGDLRFHLVTTVATPQTNSPWGIMSDANDPLTGEHIAGSINVWSHVNDLFSRGIIDTLRYIGGELATSDVTDGKYIHQWVEAAKNSNGMGLTPLLDDDQRDARVAAAAGTTVEKLRAMQVKAQRAQLSGEGIAARAALTKQLEKVGKMKAAWDVPDTKAPIYETRFNMLRGTPIEAELTSSPAMQQLGRAALGKGAATSVTGVGDRYAYASVLQALNPALHKNLEHRFENALAQRGSCIMNYEATAPLGYVALSDILQQKFGAFNKNDDPQTQMARADAMKDWLRRRAHYAVISHEMGHSFGHRHNFVSSSDAWNFRPQYWALRTNGKDVKTACPGGTNPGGASCVGPRWQDTVTANETKNMIHLWSQSSTMEYAGEPAQDLLGLGTYDFAAARHFYGDTVTVYDNPSFSRTSAGGRAAIDHQNNFGGLLGFRYGSFSQPIHYSQLDARFNMITSCETVRDPQAFRPRNWDDKVDGIWNPIVDGHLVTKEDGNTWIRCKQPNVDYVQWDGMQSTDEKTHAFEKAPTGRVRVPHGFASDEWADLGNITVFRHDNGADLYETMHFWIAQQEMNHIFNSYRRGRRDFSIWSAFMRNLVRYHEKMRDSAKAIGLFVNLAKDTVTHYNSLGTDPEAVIADVLQTYAVDNTVASSIGFDHFTHVFSRTQPGGHGQLGDSGDPVLRSVEGTGFTNPPAASIKVANGVTGGFGTISLGGRPIENALANDKGRDYDRDYTLNVGSYYEKAFTAYLFSESADNFISSSRDDFVDPRFRAVSLADIFPDGYRRWLGNNLTGDDTIKGVFAKGVGSGTGVQPPALDDEGYVTLGRTLWWPKTGMQTCFPQGEKINCRDPFDATPVPPGAPATGPTIDPQIGWEQQKFAALFSFVYLPDNQKTVWLDMMRIYDLSVEGDPGFDNRVEFHDPEGRIYVAKSYGTEVLFGKTVEKGIAARVLQYANQLLQAGVETAPVVRGGVTVGYKPVLTGGQPRYKNGTQFVNSCANSRACTQMKNYTAMPKWLNELGIYLGMTRFDGLKGIY